MALISAQGSLLNSDDALSLEQPPALPPPVKDRVSTNHLFIFTHPCLLVCLVCVSLSETHPETRFALREDAVRTDASTGVKDGSDGKGCVEEGDTLGDGHAGPSYGDH